MKPRLKSSHERRIAPTEAAFRIGLGIACTAPERGATSVLAARDDAGLTEEHSTIGPFTRGANLLLEVRRDPLATRLVAAGLAPPDVAVSWRGRASA